MVERALDGVKVIEYASFVAGPYCAKLLADLGAEVIKIEPPGIGDEARARGPFLHDIPHPDLSGLFLYLNGNKLGVTLNLDSATGRAIFKRLVASSDVLIEDHPPGKMAEMGLGYDILSGLNPRLIVMSVTPFGQTGPYRDYKAYYLNTFHASGAGYLLPSSSPNLDREPIKGPGFLGEYDAGLCAAVAILGALYWRGASGLGQHIDVSKQEALMALEKMELARFHDEGKNPSRGPAGRPPMKFIRSKDGGLLLLEAPRDNQWQGLVALMGNPDWAKDEKFSTEQGRRENGDELRGHLAEWAQDYTADELFHGVQSKQCPAAPVNSVEEFLSSPQIKAREFLTEIDHPVAGKLAYPSSPYHFSETPSRVERPAPLVGQHNEEIFGHRLGYTREDLVKFKEAGVI
jgi:crotonobetainyl-CoA:carnitine CoA-transferase CaiB-like acyl-CoA transferase